MSLLQEYMTPCQMVEERRIPDGEGGWTTSWADGAAFRAAVVCNRSSQTRAAEKQGVSSVYIVNCAPGARLAYHDVFRRLSDGKTFRVTSDGNDVQTPERATFQFSQVTAEAWELPL